LKFKNFIDDEALLIQKKRFPLHLPFGRWKHISDEDD